MILVFMPTNETNHNQYGSGISYVTEVNECIVYILYGIICLPIVIQYTVDCGYLMQPPNAKEVSGYFPPSVFATYFTSIYSYTIN